MNCSSEEQFGRCRGMGSSPVRRRESTHNAAMVAVLARLTYARRQAGIHADRASVVEPTNLTQLPHAQQRRQARYPVGRQQRLVLEEVLTHCFQERVETARFRLQVPATRCAMS
jgi:hypothetical protein